MVRDQGWSFCGLKVEKRAAERTEDRDRNFLLPRQQLDLHRLFYICNKHHHASAIKKPVELFPFIEQKSSAVLYHAYCCTKDSRSIPPLTVTRTNSTPTLENS